jgi:hypothetical protein
MASHIGRRGQAGSPTERGAHARAQPNARANTKAAATIMPLVIMVSPLAASRCCNSKFVQSLTVMAITALANCGYYFRSLPTAFRDLLPKCRPELSISQRL